MKKAAIQSSFENDDDDQSPIDQVTNFFKKPQGFIMTILLCVIVMMGLQFGQLQHQIDLMGKQVKNYKK